MKRQIFLIPGGETFISYKKYLDFLKNYELKPEKFSKKRWKENLGEDLGRNYEVFIPRMPNSLNAKYAEWKIWFEKLIPIMRPRVILIGHSLGGIFLTKYLSENKFRKKIKSVFIVSAPFCENELVPSLADFKLRKDLSLITKQCEDVYFYHSKDDEIVSFSDMEKYQELLPKAIFRVFKNRGHFRQTRFKEIVRDIKKI